MITSANDHAPGQGIFDVAIVGFGPVGQALALGLAQHGHSVVVLEKWPHLYGLPRAVGLDHEAMRILQSLGIADALEVRTQLSDVYEWRNTQQQTLMAFPGMSRPGLSGWAQMRSFNQPTLERMLAEKIREEHAGQVTVYNGITVVGLQEHPDHVFLEGRSTLDTTGPGREVTARYVVGCDGAASFVRASMGSEMEDISFAADWLVVDLVPHDPAACTNELIQLCDPKRPTTAVSGGPRRRRFEFMMLEGERKEEFNNAAAAWELLKPWGWTPHNALLERHAVYTFRAAVADRWRRGRLMIAGDAAHLTPPFAAQGLCAGLRDMASLVWRLDMVLREQASDALLEDYTSERRTHAKILVEFAVELGKIICLLDPRAAAGRDQALLSADKREPEKMPDPRLGPSALIKSGDSAAGLLSLQGRVRQFGREGRFDDFFGHRFVLLGNGYDPTTRLSHGQRAFLMAIGARCAGIGVHCNIQDIEGSYRRWFATLNADAILVRPDYYILGSGDPAGLIDHLMSAWTLFAPTRALS